MNPSLADILLSNLLSNSIKHNIFGGDIKIFLISDKLSVKNSGGKLSIEPDILFDRFVKESTSNDSIGLGLSLVKQICEINSFTITYQYSNSQHQIDIHF
jgi:signal transduction histidine kinase